MKHDYFKTAQEFVERRPARALIAKAMKELLPDKQNYFGFVLSVILSVTFALIICKSTDTVEITEDVATVFLGIQLAVFGCIFAVYSILLAFLSDSFMKRLANIDMPDEVNLLKKSTLYYESVLFLYFVNIGITGIVLIACKVMDTHFRLTDDLCFDTAFACVLLILYFWFSCRVFYEVKSTIYNTILLFRSSISYKFIDFAIEDSKEKQTNEQNKIDEG